MSEQKFDPKKFIQYKLKPNTNLINVLKAKPAAVSRPARKPVRKQGSALRFTFTAVLIALFIVIIIRSFFAQAFFVPSDSMEPLLNFGDVLLVNKMSYGIGNPLWGIYNTELFFNAIPNPAFHRLGRISKGRYIVRLARDPARMDLIVLISPVKGQEGRMLVKRIIGLPRDTVKISKGRVYVNGRRIKEKDSVTRDMSDLKPTRVPYGSYFVLGDNRSKSLDSRKFGFVSGEDIAGQVFMRIWPVGKSRSVK